MRRIFVLALAALALLGVVTPDAFAQAPTPKFTMNGLIDQVTSYNQNLSVYDGNLATNDKGWYGRTRGRLDFIGEVGKAKGVVGIELDLAYGQTGSADNNGQAAGGASANGAAQVCSGCTGSFDLNTDVRTVFELKWLYTEFEVPLIPVPSVVRLGAQPFGSAGTYKVGTYATGDFAGINWVSTITPNVKLNFTYAQVEEGLSGCTQQPCTGTSGGIAFSQLRGGDAAFLLAPEITPFKGLDLKPLYSYFYASGTTNAASRTGRGGVNTTTAYTQPNGDWRAGINENRQTVGVDSRLRMGPFSLDTAIMFQFGNRDVVVPGVPGGPCSVTNSSNCLASASGKAPGSVAQADISAGFFDTRAGFQIGPLLIEGMYMFSSGNKARDTTLNHVNFFQPLSTDTGYLADWGTQISSLGLDYFNSNANALQGYPGVGIGWDKYGRQQASLKATYFLTPSLNIMSGAAVLLTHRAIDTDAVTSGSPGGVPGGGLLPAYATGKQDGDTNYMGTELFSQVTWNFAPGLSWGNAAGYVFSGDGLDAFTLSTGSRNAKNIFIITSRLRFTF